MKPAEQSDRPADSLPVVDGLPVEATPENELNGARNVEVEVPIAPVRRRRWKYLWVAPVAIVVLLLGGRVLQRLTSPDEEPQQTSEQARFPVKTVKAVSAPIQAWVFGEGFASAVRRKHLTFEVAGTIVYVKQVEGRELREGDFVGTGELLASVDDRQLVADIRAAEAQEAEAREQVDSAIAQRDEALANVEQARAALDGEEARVGQSRANLSQAEASLEKTRAQRVEGNANLRKAESALVDAQVSLKQARGDRELALAELQRRQDLYEEDLIPLSELDEYTNRLQNADTAVESAETRVLTAREDVAAAESQIVAIERDIDAAESQVEAAFRDIDAAESQVDAARSQISASQVRAIAAESQIDATAAGVDSAIAQVSKSEVLLEDSQIFAPFDGIVAYLNIRQGDYWSPQRINVQTYQDVVESVPIVLIDPSEFEVIIELPSFEGGQVRVGQRAYIVLDDKLGAAASGQVESDDLIQLSSAQGRVFAVSPSVTPGGRAVKVSIRVNQGTARLREGARVSCWIAVEEKLNATVAPQQAFVFRDRQPHVFVVADDNTVRQRPVELGIEGLSVLEIVEGVRPGDTLVTDGKNLLVEGAAVEIVE